MYSSKSLETPETDREFRQAAEPSSVDWDALRSAAVDGANANADETPQKRLIDLLERVLGSAGFDLELSLQAAEPYVVGCRLTIFGALRSNISDPFATPSEAADDAIRKVAALFRIPL